jgi:multiple sugar transport system permease protein
MLIYVAGLKNVPQELYEAAKVDGAGVFRRFFSVTLPMLSSVLFFTAVIGVVNALQIFTQAVVLFQPLGGGGDTASAMAGGTGSAALFYIMYLFSQAFAYFKMGYASALAWVLFLIIMAITVIQLAMARLWVYYEAGSAGVAGPR